MVETTHIFNLGLLRIRDDRGGHTTQKLKEEGWGTFFLVIPQRRNIINKREKKERKKNTKN